MAPPARGRALMTATAPYFFCGYAPLFFVRFVPNSYYLVYLRCNFNRKGMSKVIHVHLIGKRKDYYFGSIAAIYSVLTPEQVGMTRNSLAHAGLGGGGAIATKTALIKQSRLIRSARDLSPGEGD